MGVEWGDIGAVSRPKPVIIAFAAHIGVIGRVSADCVRPANRFNDSLMAYADGDAGNRTAARADDAAPPVERCGLAAAIDVVGDRWTLLIIRSALYGVTRFDDLQTSLGAPRTVLSNRLKKLVDDGVLRRRAYKAEGQRTRHQYVLTQKGVDLALPLMALMQWGQKHVLAEANAGGIVSRRTGKPLRLGLVDAAGSTATLADAQFKAA